MKILILWLYFLVCPISCFAQRYYSERSYNIVGLADRSEIRDCLVKGLPFFLIGLTIFLICIHQSKQAVKEKREYKESRFGCISLILMGIGFILMLPLWAWIEAIGVTLLYVAIGIAIIYCIYEKLKMK